MIKTCLPVVALKDNRTWKVYSLKCTWQTEHWGLSPCDRWMDLTVAVEKNDKGSFAVINPTPSDKATAEHQRECLKWLKVIKDSKVEIVEEEIRLADSEEFTKF